MTDFTRCILTPRIKVGRDVVQKAQTKEQVMHLPFIPVESSIHLFIHPLSTHPSICLSVHPRIHPCTHSSTLAHPSIHHLSIPLFIYPPMHLSISSFIFPYRYSHIHPSIHPFIRHQCIYPSFSPSVHIFIPHPSNTRIFKVHVRF